MKYVYKSQPYSLSLDANNALSGASSISIVYRKPDGTEGSLTGTMDGTNVTASVTGAINDTVGVWSFQTSAIISGDTAASLGDVFLLRVKDDWES